MGYSACFSIATKELQDTGFAGCVSLLCQTMNDLLAVLLGTVVEKNSLFDTIWVNHPLRHWKDALEQFKHFRTLQEQTNTSKVCTRIGKPLTSGTCSTRFIMYGYSCGIVPDGYSYGCSTGRVWALFRYVYGWSMSMATGVLWSRTDTFCAKYHIWSQWTNTECMCATLLKNADRRE